MLTTKYAKTREMRINHPLRLHGEIWNFAGLASLREKSFCILPIMSIHVKFLVVTFRDLFNEFFRPVSAPVLLLSVVINNSVFAKCCKSTGYKT